MSLAAQSGRATPRVRPQGGAAVARGPATRIAGNSCAAGQPLGQPRVVRQGRVARPPQKVAARGRAHRPILALRPT